MGFVFGTLALFFNIFPTLPFSLFVKRKIVYKAIITALSLSLSLYTNLYKYLQVKNWSWENYYLMSERGRLFNDYKVKKVIKLIHLA